MFAQSFTQPETLEFLCDEGLLRPETHTSFPGNMFAHQPFDLDAMFDTYSNIQDVFSEAPSLVLPQYEVPQTTTSSPVFPTTPTTTSSATMAKPTTELSDLAKNLNSRFRSKPSVQVTAVTPALSFRFIGTFGVEVIREPSAGKILAGSEILIHHDHAEKAFFLQNSTSRVGRLPGYVYSWLSVLFLRGWLQLIAKIPKYKTTRLLAVISVNAVTLTTEDRMSMTVTELGAWGALAEKLSLTTNDILPALPASVPLKVVPSKFRSSPLSMLSPASPAPSAGLLLNLGPKRKREDETSEKDIPIKINFKRLKTEHETSNEVHMMEPIRPPSLPILEHGSLLAPNPLESFSEDKQLQLLFENLSHSTDVEMPEMDPASTLQLTLRPYQKQALYWMVNRENSVGPLASGETADSKRLPEHWHELVSTMGKKYYFNQQTKQTTWSFPYKALAEEPGAQLHAVKVRGGILADQMGMGKTIEILALILTNRPKAIENNSNNSPKGNLIKSTLIVCPLSVLNQWDNEIRSHTAEGTLSVYVYHGASRKRCVNFLSQFDVVLTTYSTLSGELASASRSKSKNSSDNDEDFEETEESHQSEMEASEGLLSVPWYRIVLDEAHTIKDKTTRNAKAAYRLSAQCRWAVTGTPIQNKLDDIYSLFRFLRVDPYGDVNWWNHIIMRPIRSRDERGFSRLQAVLKTILLRRTKDQRSSHNNSRIVSLPPRIIKEKRLRFTPEEDAFYQRLWTESKRTFRKLTENGQLLKNYAHILELLLRLRQACDHSQLVLNSRLSKQLDNQLEHDPASDDNKINDDKNGIIDAAVATPSASCPGFLAPESSWAPAQRESVLDHDNVLSFDQLDMDIDAMEECGMSLSTIFSKIPQSPVKSEPTTTTTTTTTTTAPALCASKSTKINALLQEMDVILRTDPSIKSIIFSQWTSMLDLLEQPLNDAGYHFVRLDGAMSQTQRQNAVDAFNNDPTVTLFLVSMKAGGLGLNLTAGSRVFLLDPWWNPATEDQAIDRVHRIGQTREVIVYRFIIEGTVEERILELQEKKRNLAQGALSGGALVAVGANGQLLSSPLSVASSNDKLRKQLRVEELQLLFKD